MASTSGDTELQPFLDSLLKRVDGLKAVVIADRDGVVVAKAVTEDAPAKLLVASTLSTLSVTTEQASKLGLGKTQAITSVFQSNQIIHFNEMPLVVCFVADLHANTSALLAIGYETCKALAPVLSAVKRRAQELGLE